MFCARMMIRQFKLPRTRQINMTSLNKCKSIKETPKSNAPQEVEESVLGSPMHTVTNFDKRILVWVKRYPSLDQVPQKVTIECMHRAHTKARIFVCCMMMVFAAIGFITSSMLGKRDVASGKHILTERLKYYEEMRAKGKAEGLQKS